MSLRADDRGISEAVALVVSAVVGLVVAFGLTWLVIAPADSFYESLFRIGPTLEQGGVGADWVGGNTMPALNFLISLTHAADVLMGLFILLMVFVHWGAFRRLAAQMRTEPARYGDTRATADGGTDRDPDARDDGGEPR